MIEARKDHIHMTPTQVRRMQAIMRLKVATIALADAVKERSELNEPEARTPERPTRVE